ncbi:MAG: hypothetical protein QXR89_06995 [Candidatus Bathyarchaeia archaeon]
MPPDEYMSIWICCFSVNATAGSIGGWMSHGEAWAKSIGNCDTTHTERLYKPLSSPGEIGKRMHQHYTISCWINF